MPEFTVITLTLAAIGLIQGILVYPCVWLSQTISTKLFSPGGWMYMLLTMTLWALCMVGIAVAMNQFLDEQIRRGHIGYWVAGFLIGTAVGTVVIDHWRRQNRS